MHQRVVCVGARLECGERWQHAHLEAACVAARRALIEGVANLEAETKAGAQRGARLHLLRRRLQLCDALSGGGDELPEQLHQHDNL